MKIDNRFGSIWDELPDSSTLKKEKKIPTTQADALEFHQAAEQSIHNSTMKVWDAHNDMMAKSAELRKISARKKILERQTQERLEKNRELLKESKF
ncbi:MAG: hypothetical protein IJR94_02585 [Synergistaceae bacterium]|nr:hypothetical protein [Synergistaceae bacterium]